MLDHPTLDHLKALRFDGTAEAFAELRMRDATANSATPNGLAS